MADADVADADVVAEAADDEWDGAVSVVVEESAIGTARGDDVGQGIVAWDAWEDEEEDEAAQAAAEDESAANNPFAAFAWPGTAEARQ